MNEINLKLKNYDELTFEITTLITNKYLLEQKVNKQKEVLDKIKEDLEKTKIFNTSYQDKYGNEFINVDIDHINYLLELLEEIEGGDEDGRK